MELHRTSGRVGRGLALALTTVALWGMLPLALKGVLAQADPVTITWVRFLVSGIALGGWLAFQGQLPGRSVLQGGRRGLLAAATLFLAANYLGYIVGLDHTTPADAQVVIQLAPLLLALGGITVFRERFSGLQWLGVGVLVAGLGLFFSARLGRWVGELDAFLVGNAWMVFAAVTWAVYGLAQKQLLHSLSSQQVMACIYLGCTLLFAPLARPVVLAELDATGLALLAFCAANTLVAYGAFSESLEHWEASRVSAVLALTPLATLALAAAAEVWWPGLSQPAVLGWVGWVGAVLVVAGSLTTALGARRDADA